MPRAGRLPGAGARTAMRAAGPLAAPARGWARWDPGTAGRPGFRLPGASGLRPQVGRLGGAGGAKRLVRLSASLGGGGGGSGGGRSGGGGGDGHSSSVCPPSARAKAKHKAKEEQAADVYAKRLADLYWPVLHNLGFSGVVGWITAFFLKAVGKALALLAGGLFALVQVAAYTGLIEVKWTKVHEDVIKHLDINKDGSFDASDFQSVLASLLAILSQGVPSVGGFFAGFVLGLK